jgi:hypothetical protein
VTFGDNDSGELELEYRRPPHVEQLRSLVKGLADLGQFTFLDLRISTICKISRQPLSNMGVSDCTHVSLTPSR